MYAVITSWTTLLFVFLYFIIYPLAEYLRDTKGLRRFPSFKPLSGVTNLVFMREALLGFRSKTLYLKHKNHTVLRIGPNSLSYGSVDAIKDIYGHGTKCLKGEFYETLAGTHFHLADAVDKSEHARKRKVLSAAYALKNLENWEHKVADKTERFIRGCDKACTKPLEEGFRQDSADLAFDYRAWTNYFTLDAIADIGLSEKLGFLDQGHDLVRAERLDGTIHEVNYRACLHSTALAQSITAWVPEWYNFNQSLTSMISPTFRSWWKLNKDWNDIVYYRATQRLQRYKTGEKLDDFFQALMEDKNGDPHGLEWGEIVAEVSIMMNAGSDTTAIAMNNVMYWLLKNQRCMAKLREEVDAVMEPDEVVAPYDKVKHLPYLWACLDESLRIVPPTTFGLPRRTPPEGAYILGDFIPGNTTVSISAYVVHRDPKIFPDPESYIPERWMSERGKDLQPYFVSFSAGARGCIGRNISYLEQTVLLASVLHRYNFALPYPKWEPERREAMNCMPSSMPLKVWRR
ncbi:cytochrome p450 oxidoreductase [Colletotrichum incanum]|uniref:Cytochrome p450 oxidoreductase n=1 Tax=Colletotrichum incanum TaxID=1573173 RepID=A0A167D2A3_COLIC|nr:cytochrome p450 oxidoreductase [Colletotrichum incanum]OHW98310.1 cytochrome P450 oxidoreductase [Colletotrichum incanum]